MSPGGYTRSLRFPLRVPASCHPGSGVWKSRSSAGWVSRRGEGGQSEVSKEAGGGVEMGCREGQIRLDLTPRTMKISFPSTIIPIRLFSFSSRSPHLPSDRRCGGSDNVATVQTDACPYLESAQLLLNRNRPEIEPHQEVEIATVPDG